MIHKFIIGQYRRLYSHQSTTAKVIQSVG